MIDKQYQVIIWVLASLILPILSEQVLLVYKMGKLSSSNTGIRNINKSIAHNLKSLFFERKKLHSSYHLFFYILLTTSFIELKSIIVEFDKNLNIEANYLLIFIVVKFLSVYIFNIFESLRKNVKIHLTHGISLISTLLSTILCIVLTSENNVLQSLALLNLLLFFLLSSNVLEEKISKKNYAIIFILDYIRVTSIFSFLFVLTGRYFNDHNLIPVIVFFLSFLTNSSLKFNMFLSLRAFKSKNLRLQNYIFIQVSIILSFLGNNL